MSGRKGRIRIEASLLGDPGLLWGTAVLVHPGWSRRWGSDAYLTGSPYLTAGTARALVEANVALVGIDALNIDDIETVAGRRTTSCSQRRFRCWNS